LSPGPDGSDAIQAGPLARGETGAAARALAAAFLDDPVATAIGPRRRSHRRAIAPLSFSGIVAASARHGGRVDVARSAGEVVGVSIAFDPGRWPITDGAAVYELAWALLAGPLPISRGISFDRTVRASHVDHEHMYLWFLGVHPAAQGRGVGRTLLADLHGRSDERGVPTYLETGTMDNVAWYASLGYELLGEIELPNGAPLWRMQRPEGPSG
jgi:ribosomal protein S18 acetylase RimI-like enzyme